MKWVNKMDSITISKRYAKAIYDIAFEKSEEFNVFEMLTLIQEQLEKNEDFKKFLNYPVINKEDKIELVNKIYNDIKGISLDILDYLLDKDKLIYIKDILSEYTKIYYAKHNKLVVRAIFPKELTDIQKDKLKKNLELKKKKEVIIQYIVDENLIGGGIIKINDEVIDGSIRSQLDNLK